MAYMDPGNYGTAISLPMVPLFIYTSSRRVMGEFVNRHLTIVVGVAIAVAIIVLNGYLVYTST